MAIAAVSGTIATVPELAAQTPPSAPAPGNVLTLPDAITLARRNNPVYQSATNARRTAAAAVRAANSAYLPNVNTSFSTGFREGRQTFFQGQSFGAANDQLSSDIGASANMSFSLATLSEQRVARANAEATEADISGAEQRVRTDVTTQYLTALQAQARAVLQDTLLTTTAAQLQLARARFAVGSATQLDVQRAEVADGQQRVAALNARNQAAIEIIRLFQQIGIPAVSDARLDPNLPPIPAVDLNTILEQARTNNPQLDALRFREQAAIRGVSTARSSYYPSLSISANVSAFTNRVTDVNQLITSGQASALNQRTSCISREEVRAAVGLPNQLAQCDLIAFTPTQEALIRDSQGKYPFDFTRNPYSLSLGLSLPVFNGFRREQQVEQANVQRRNAQLEVRAQELRLAADIQAASLSLATSQQTVALQEQNVRTARVALELAQERYRVGQASLVELVQARSEYERAETDRITAVYDVQRAFTALEAAVGRPLR